MTPAQFRKLVLSLEGVEAVPHMERTAFRTKRKIFATLGDDKRVNIMVEPAERRDALLDSFPEAFFSLGGWTRLGYIAVDIAKADPDIFRELVNDAYRAALPVTKARAPKAAPTTRKQQPRARKQR
jgi:hypothetical protein